MSSYKFKFLASFSLMVISSYLFKDTKGDLIFLFLIFLWGISLIYFVIKWIIYEEFKEEYRKRNKNIIQAYKKSEKIKIPKNQKCENCKKELAIHKHHEDYSKPLNIKFLCLSCHRQLHKDRRAN